MPLIDGDVINNLIREHIENNNDLTILTTQIKILQDMVELLDKMVKLLKLLKKKMLMIVSKQLMKSIQVFIVLLPIF